MSEATSITDQGQAAQQQPVQTTKTKTKTPRPEQGQEPVQQPAQQPQTAIADAPKDQVEPTRQEPDPDRLDKLEAQIAALTNQLAYAKSDATRPGEEGLDDAPRVKDEDLPYLADALSDEQVRRILMIRGNAVSRKKWADKGVRAGIHWIPQQRVRCTVKGIHGQELVPDQPVLVTDLDAETTADLRAKGLILAPGEEGLALLTK